MAKRPNAHRFNWLLHKNRNLILSNIPTCLIFIGRVCTSKTILFSFPIAPSKIIGLLSNEKKNRKRRKFINHTLYERSKQNINKKNLGEKRKKKHKSRVIWVCDENSINYLLNKVENTSCKRKWNRFFCPPSRFAPFIPSCQCHSPLKRSFLARSELN